MAKFPEMNWSASNLAEEFKLFRQRTELCFLDHNIVDPIKQATKIKIAVGNEGLRKINASGLSIDDQNYGTFLKTNYRPFCMQLKKMHP